MGVDFYACSQCRDTFPDCGVFSSCETCGEMLCPRCMTQLSVGSRLMDEPDEDDADEGYEQCPFCAKQLASDAALLEFALSEMGITKDELAARYRK